MVDIRFYEKAEDDKLQFAVILSRSQDKWVFCKHRERDTYEVPGGHRERDAQGNFAENIRQTAYRELKEETGAIEFSLTPVCVYSVRGNVREGKSVEEETFGMLYFADIRSFEKELHSEIEHIILTEKLPERWTYPLIQPKLLEHAGELGFPGTGSFRIVSCAALTQEQKQEVEALQEEVYRIDKLQNMAWLSNELNFDRELCCFFLGYEGGELAAFLTLFLPSRQEGEVQAFTRNDRRNRGYFTALLKEAARVLWKASVPDILFPLEPLGESGRRYLKDLMRKSDCSSVRGIAVSGEEVSKGREVSEDREVSKGREVSRDSEISGQGESVCDCLESLYSHTEYRMVCQPSYEALPEGSRVVRADSENLKDYLSISERECGEAGEEILNSDTRAGYLLYVGQEPVAVFDMDYGKDLFLCGVVVSEEKRGRGYGRQLVRAALNIAFEAGRELVLDVDTENPPALWLYRKVGFTPVFQVDYYRISTEMIINYGGCDR